MFSHGVKEPYFSSPDLDMSVRSTPTIWESEPPRASTIEPIAIGARIKAARIAKGFSQSEVATRIGLLPSYISKLESGKKGVSQSKMVELARLLDLPVSTILGDTVMELEPEAMQLARRFQALPPEKQAVVQAALKAMESA